ncbi:MAG: peptidoglycan DD-metalloendopeptidase family protein [Actinomycetota bacterium]|nr:peptidoglycan DD-metalloendopeptidase family protein [Actinomycetota bacterium]
MGGTFARAGLAVAALVTLLGPAAFAAGPGQELQETKEKLAGVRERIEEHEAEAGTLKRRVDGLNSEIHNLQVEMNRLDRQRAKVESEVRGAEARIQHTQARIRAIEERATEQAVMLYKSGATDALDALLDSKTLRELDERLAYLGVAAKRNTGFLVRYGRLKLEIEAQHRQLFKKEKELEAILQSRSLLLREQEQLRADLTGDLKRLRKQLGAERAQEGHLEDEAAALTQDIVAAQAASAVQTAGAPVQSLGRSASGFIWPLNGPITSSYGPRWGRMHTGIDIDGYTGQPVVASKDGRVILAQSYSGYGNTVIVDHGGGVATLYAHMSSFGVSGGQGVSQGAVVGRVGCTGSCTGDHLHFEVRVNGRPVNPLAYLP